MATGAITSDYLKYKYGGVFAAYSQAVYSSGSTAYAWYSAELGGFIKPADTVKGTLPSGLGETSNVKNGAYVWSDSDCTTRIGTFTVVNCELYRVTQNIVGNGSIVTSSATHLLGGRYVRGDLQSTFTARAASGSAFVSLKRDGIVVSGGSVTFSPTADTVLEATFHISQYQVTTPTVSGSGSVKVMYDGVEKATPFAAQVGHSLRFVCTPTINDVLSYVEIDGSRYVTSDTTVTLPGRPSDSTIESRAVFVSRVEVFDSIAVTAGGSVAVKDAVGGAVPVASGRFGAYSGAQYSIYATPASGFRLDGVYADGIKMSGVSPYSFVQRAESVAFRVVFVEGGSAGLETLACGSSSSASDATWNGCSCSYSVSSGTYTFVPSAAAGYSFVRLYVEDLDGTGKGRVIPAGASLSLVIDFRAKVVAVFRSSSSPQEPDDEDQGGNPQPRSVSVGEWEGGVSRMSATWKSRRNVFPRPVGLSCARVYADSYDSGSPRLTVHQYASPSQQDVSGTVADAVVRSQNAFRLVHRRPEKYVEIELRGSDRILEAAVSTSMEGLWQGNS